MADIKQKGMSNWSGDLQTGTGTLSVGSGLVENLPLTFASRFQGKEGSNPEELIGAAHAGCYNMVVADVLAKGGHPPQKLETTATVTLSKVEGGFKVTAIALHTRGGGEDIDLETLRSAAETAKENCPISQLLKPGLDSLTVDVELI